MNRSKARLLLTVSLLALAGTASAQQSGRTDFYGGVSLGQAKFNANTGGIDSGLATAGGIGGISSAIDGRNTGFKLRLGYRLSDRLALEGGYVDFGKANYSASYTVPGAGNASGRMEAEGVNFDVLGRIPLNRGFAVFGKAGVLLSRVETNVSSADGSASVSSRATTLRPGLGGGIDYTLSRNVSLRTEWERYFKVGNDSTGKSDVDLLSAGLDYRF